MLKSHMILPNSTSQVRATDLADLIGIYILAKPLALGHYFYQWQGRRLLQ